MALKRVWIPSPHYSSRGANVRLIVLHTAEGARTIESLGSWFQNPSAKCSSHVGADDKPNTVGEYVSRGNKAWTQSEFNPVAVSIELCGFASWSNSEWRNNHATMLENCAKWVAEEAAHYGIPIVQLNSSQAQGSGRGVCQHVDLGQRGGGHHDCGSGFPMAYVLDMARGRVGPPASTEKVVGDMVASGLDANKGPHVFWVGSNRHQIFYKYQQGNQWKGGGLFAELSQNVTGLSCSVTNGDVFTIHARCDDGNVYYTWQARGQTKWNGGSAGKVAGFVKFN